MWNATGRRVKVDFTGSRYLVFVCGLFYDAEHISEYIVSILG
jgi:hypothetical protein